MVIFAQSHECASELSFIPHQHDDAELGASIKAQMKTPVMPPDSQAISQDRLLLIPNYPNETREICNSMLPGVT